MNIFKTTEQCHTHHEYIHVFYLGIFVNVNMSVPFISNVKNVD